MQTLGNASSLYICPTCGCPDLEIAQSSLVLAATERKTRCPNCSWAGMLSDAAGIASTEKLYDTKAVLNLLLFVVTKHAAGPIAQALQFVGLVEAGDQVGIDKIMREATAGLIEKAFMAASEHAAEKAMEQAPSLHTLADCSACRGTCMAGNEGCPLCRATGKSIGRLPVAVQLALVDQKVAELQKAASEIPKKECRCFGSKQIHTYDELGFTVAIPCSDCVGKAEEGSELKELAAFLQKNTLTGEGGIILGTDVAEDLGIDPSAGTVVGDAVVIGGSEATHQALVRGLQDELVRETCGDCNYCDTSSEGSRCNHHEGSQDQVVDPEKAPPETCPIKVQTLVTLNLPAKLLGTYCAGCGRPKAGCTNCGEA